MEKLVEMIERLQKGIESPTTPKALIVGMKKRMEELQEKLSKQEEESGKKQVEPFFTEIDVFGPVAKETKSKPSKPPKEKKEPKTYPIDLSKVEDCKLVISQSLKMMKNQKLRAAKDEKIGKIKAKLKDGDISREEAEAKIEKVEDMSYTQAFAVKVPLSEKINSLLLSIFNKVVYKNSYDIRESKSIPNDEKLERLERSCDDTLAIFQKDIVPIVHKLYLGDPEPKAVHEFAKDAGAAVEKTVEKLKNHFQLKNAA